VSRGGAVDCVRQRQDMTMRDFMGYATIGVLAVLAMALVTIAGLGLAVGARPVEDRGAIIQHVDRANKGDRLDVRRTLGTRPQAPENTAIPVGCEPALSPLASPREARIASRCLA
jgi:hypothetical protein